MSRGVSIYESRRTAFEKCEYYKRKNVMNQNGKVDYSILAHNDSPDGFFYAEETAPLSETGRTIADMRVTGRTVTLITSDDIIGHLFKDDIVKYDGRFYRVESITFQRDWKRSQFGRKNKDGQKVITLVG